MRAQGDRVFLTLAEACALLPDKEYVHTFTQPAAGILCGADWKRSEVVDLLTSCTDPECAEVSGEQAQAMGHGLVVHRNGAPLLFVEAARWEEAVPRG